MIEMSRPEMTVEALVARMRAVVARAHRDAPPPAGEEDERSARAARVTALLDGAERVAWVGSTFPPLAAFSGLLHYPARWAARLVLFLSRFITDAQAHFNISVLQALRELNQAVGSLPTAQGQPPEGQDASHPLADPLYFALHDRFRGSPQMIRERLRVYLPLMRETRAQAARLPVLDLGCGRGEWLELLREENYPARGIDLNPAAVALCQERGLEVVEAEAIGYLQSQPDASLAAITAFHLIEHLPFSELIRLIDEAVRVLQPGGVAIFETPNPENVLVGSCGFYMDPTHAKPLPSAIVKFVAESRGLSQVEVMLLHPSPEALPPDGSQLVERFNSLLYGPQDYAVVGRRL